MNNERFYVYGVNGEKWGPATVAELDQWVAEGRIKPTMQVESVTSGFRTTVGALTRGSITPPIGAALGYGGSSSIGSPHGTYHSQGANYPRATTTMIDNFLIKAIFSTICCCMPFGIVAIVFAAQVDSAWRRGDFDESQRLSDQANMWSNIAIGLGLAQYVLGFLFQGLILATVAGSR